MTFNNEQDRYHMMSYKRHQHDEIRVNKFKRETYGVIYVQNNDRKKTSH